MVGPQTDGGETLMVPRNAPFAFLLAAILAGPVAGAATGIATPPPPAIH